MVVAMTTCVVVACSGKGPSGFAGSDGPTSSDAGDDAPGSASFDGGDNPLNLGDTGTSISGMGTGVCKDGTYSGTFMCTFIFDPDAGADDAGEVSADAGGLPITGTISFQLTQNTGSGESFIDTASGTVNGTAATFFTIMGNLGGTLNCNSGVFVGNLSNGAFMDDGPVKLISGTFGGPLSSQYNGTTFSFVDGQWLLTVPGEGRCKGTWSASYGSDQ